jgi:anaerobic sulfite reductase subunit C
MTEPTFDLAELKKVGMIQQKQKEYFSLRLHVIGGDLTTIELAKIVEVANKYGKGQVHLSTRQGLEIPNIHHTTLIQARQELESVGLKMGACGPRIRIVVACPGSDTCRWGIIDTKKMAKNLDSKYFRQDTPHKFKFAVTGCPHNCAKASENDIGVMGGILPKWKKEDCINCDLCINICPTNAIYKENDEYKLNLEKCIHCSICTASCPTDAWIKAKTGFLLFIGGTMGKIPRLGSKLKELISDETELNKLIDKSLDYYRKNGRKKERFGHMIDRIGLKEVKEAIINGI